LLVSHSMSTIAGNCDKALFLQNGSQVSFGKVDHVLEDYRKSLELQPRSTTDKKTIPKSNNSFEETGIGILNVELIKNDFPTDNIEMGSSANLKVKILLKKRFKDLNLSFLVKNFNANLETVLDMSSQRDKFLVDLEAGTYNWTLSFPHFYLAPGRYSIKVFVSQSTLGNVLDAIESFDFVVNSSEGLNSSLFYQPREWAIQESLPNAKDQ
jgi:hypothetical protein